MDLNLKQSCYIIILSWFLLIEITYTKTEYVNCSATILQGGLTGVKMSSLFGRQFCAFLGIPYAQPPLGFMRFKEPKSPSKWTGVLNTTTKGKLCIGTTFQGYEPEMSEDCLYLDVYTPKLRSSSKEIFSVLVFFPDDTYLGDESYVYGPDFLMDRGIILVMINYRVGPLGFLSTGDTVASGNYGLKDQVQALRWVQQNIRSFGGNPNNVTIHGHGVGGACVHYHLLSPLSKGLFHRAISQSGNALNPNMRPILKPNILAQEVGKKMNCPLADEVVLVTCLRGLDQSQFVNLAPIPFAPVVEVDTELEDHFLTKHPLDIIKSGKINVVPWLMGTVNNEGAGAAAELLQNKSALFNWNDNPDDVVATPLILGLDNERNLTDFRWAQVLDFYLSKENHSITPKRIHAVMQLFGDRLYNFGMHMSAVLHALHGHTEIYKYNFAYNGTFHYRKFSNDLMPYVGANHGDDLLYIFKLPMLEVFPPGQPEIEIITKLTTVLTDFVKFGNAMSSDKRNITWEPVGHITTTNIHIKHMEMKAANPNSFEGLNLTMAEDLYKDRMNLWLSLPLPENMTFPKNFKNGGSTATSLPTKLTVFINLFLALLSIIVI